ncbi:NitT/TauT family transport system permease protein [Paenibacillus catalpae]|uniref:NitT/TauT family transport system permease protein n=1 Tax=Paenibacillus catalpae TaxID=1045775 RepID=A0A1I2E6Q9_9BACL|nr:ABC transporter permease [Paenibacillus catalpae]SFE88316.1 NitT/TauT family transport system permease protein [Paenibacillus catalpae]
MQANGQVTNASVKVLAQEGISAQAGFLKKHRQLIYKTATPMAFILLLLALWQLGVRIFDTPKYLLPAPSDIWQAARKGFPDLMQAAGNTFIAALLGFLLSVALGTAVALLMMASKWIRWGIQPYAVVLQTIPVVAIAPLVVIWLGPGMNSIVFISLIVAIFPIISNTNLGLSSTDRNLIQLMRMYKSGTWMMTWKLRFPYALPYMLGGMKISSGMAVIGAIIGEFVAGIGGGKGGLGMAITSAAVQMQTSFLFACTIAASLLGMAFYLTVAAISHYSLRHWHESAIRPDKD